MLVNYGIGGLAIYILYRLMNRLIDKIEALNNNITNMIKLLSENHVYLENIYNVLKRGSK
jgi:hypothetical protein